MPKGKLLVLLCNTRKLYPDPNNKASQLEADFYDPQTIKWMTKHLENLGLRVKLVEADDKAYFELYRLRGKIALVYNDAEGVGGLDREAHFPAILELLGIPYTTSSPLTQAIILDKVKTKEILAANGVPVLPQIVIRPGGEMKAIHLEYPLMVKPIAEGSSAGITNKSVVNNLKELENQVNWIFSTFDETAMVEPFLSGREFSVAMLGNPPEILPIIESDHSVLPKDYLPIDSLEVKWLFEDKSGIDNLICPADLEKDLEKKIKKICLKTWEALGVTDLCRIDIRCDAAGNPYVLEVNSPPGMMPPEVSMTSYFPLAARTAGMDYEILLRKILNTAAKRYGIELF